jgi:hypothetical protein
MKLGLLANVRKNTLLVKSMFIFVNIVMHIINIFPDLEKCELYKYGAAVL